MTSETHWIGTVDAIVDVLRHNGMLVAVHDNQQVTVWCPECTERRVWDFTVPSQRVEFFHDHGCPHLAQTRRRARR